jgi:hypothetical protein
MRKIQNPLQSRSLTSLTKGLGELADRLRYQLKLPYTELTRLTSKEDGKQFLIEFAGQLSLHYSSLERNDEGLVFQVGFSGIAIADTPTPEVHELFNAAQAESVHAWGYGKRWRGKSIETPKMFRENIEVAAPRLTNIQLDALSNL